MLEETTHVVCVFTNTRDGRIEIEKQTLPDGSTTDFTFTGDVAGTLSDGESAGENVAAGSYASTETVPAGWTLTDITCDDTDSSGDTTTGIASFEVDPGETVRCVFTNTQDVGEGCTPGFWQGGVGEDLWDEPNDPDWTAAGGVGTNPFVTTDLFGSFAGFTATGTSIDSTSMIDIVGTGGTNNWVRKAARDLIAAYLNASFRLDYPYDTTTIEADWTAAVNAGTSGFQAFHAKYGAANELGCSIGNSSTAGVGIGGILLAGSMAAVGTVRSRRHRQAP